ncbi:tyrosine-type recombinase/integrase [Fructobacillus cardui]|nr:tyrosine-type recombinase/integrase [Fructobacillus cardui]MCK8627659.1 tyrosine-type recombinase/integrase [Fructobacillus cardui]
MSGNYSFQSTTGYPMTDNACNKKLAWLLEKLGAKQIKMHGLRHTHASYLLANDVDIQYVSERLGHAGVDITMKVYAHLMKEKRFKEKDKTIRLLQNL